MQNLITSGISKLSFIAHNTRVKKIKRKIFKFNSIELNHKMELIGIQKNKENLQIVGFM